MDDCGRRVALLVRRSFRRTANRGRTVIDRLVFVPAVLVPLAITGVFPHLLLTFAIFDASLAIGAWAFLGRE
jgi:hypothetical protein